MLTRQPEPEIVMESADSVSGFNVAGGDGGPLTAIYHFNATALSRLIPKGGRVLDLACGPGNFLIHLLSGRPDLRAVGLDLSPVMLAVARENFERQGLADRIELVHSNWTRADQAVSGPVDAVTCLSALHHCPTRADLTAVLGSVARLRERHGAAVWLFDLVRPEKEELLALIPQTFEMFSGTVLPEAFKQDWTTSLHAGWTLEEFRQSLNEVGLDPESVEANYSQLHSLPHVEGPREPIEWNGPAPAQADLVRAAKIAKALGQR